MSAFDIVDEPTVPITDRSNGQVTAVVITPSEGPDNISAWRITRAWKRIMGVTLNVHQVTRHLQYMDLDRPTPLADQVLAECRQSRVEVLAEIKNRAATQSEGGQGTMKNGP